MSSPKFRIFEKPTNPNLLGHVIPSNEWLFIPGFKNVRPVSNTADMCHTVSYPSGRFSLVMEVSTMYEWVYASFV